MPPLPPDDPANPAWGSAAASLPPGGKVGGGRFTLIKILGQGGMGVVWLAQDERLGELAALKFLPPQLRHDSAGIANLRRETLRSRKLSHPNIIRVHDLHEPEGEDVFFAMEYVDGPTLSELRLKQPSEVFTWTALAPLAKQLCDALDYAHGERVIHRDLKPTNLMLDGKGRLKLTDFGIATVVSDTLTRMTGTAGGTPTYMSPQQMNGEPPQPTDDIYSLGATLYELLTGTPPFHSGQIVHQVLHNQPATVTERLTERGLQNEIPPAVEAMLMACLAKDAAQRPQSAHAVADWICWEEMPHPKSLVSSLAPPEGELQTKSGWNWRVWLAFGCALVLLGGASWFLAPKKTSKGNSTAENANARVSAEELKTASAQISEPEAPGGFVSIFNGRDLTGWEGDTHWSVENGAIVGQAQETNRLNGFSFLRWREGILEDFELRLSFRQNGGAAGVDYRNVDYYNDLTGYRCRVGPGWLVDGRRKDATTSFGNEGERTMVRRVGGTNQTVVLGRSDVNGEAQHAAKPGEWNQLVITATGNHLVQQVNGVTTVDTLDERPDAWRAGVLGFQIYDKSSNTFSVEFKDIRLKRFPSSPGRTVFTDDFGFLNPKGNVVFWDNWDVAGADQKKSVGIEGENHFLEFESASRTNWLNVWRFFPLDPGWKALKISIRARARNLKYGQNSPAGASVGVGWDDRQRQPLAGSGVPPLSLARGDSAWTNLEQTYAIPEAAKFVVISPTFCNASGSVDFGDLNISVVKQAAPESTAGKVVFSDDFEDLEKPTPWKRMWLEARTNTNPGSWIWHDQPNQPLLLEKGNHFLRISGADTSERLFARMDLPIQPEWKALRFSASVRARNIKNDPAREAWAKYDDHGGATFMIEFWGQIPDSPDWKVIDVTRTPALKHDSDWVKQEATCRIPAGAMFVRFGPCLDLASGIADYDNIKVTVTEESQLVFSEDFESVGGAGRPARWSWGQPSGKSLRAENGNHFVRIEGNYWTNSSHISIELPVKPQWKTLLYSVRMRTKGLKANPAFQWSGADLAFAYVRDQGPYSGQSGVFRLKGDTDWVTKTMQSDVPTGVRSVIISPSLDQALGIADFDDIKITVVETNQPVTAPASSSASGGLAERILVAENFEGFAPGKTFHGEWNLGTVLSENNNRFLRIQNNDDSTNGQYYAWAPLPSHWKTITVSGRIRARNLKVNPGIINSGATIQLDVKEGSNLLYCTGIGEELKSNSDWVFRTATFDSNIIPSTARYVGVGLILSKAAGIADFDDLKVSVVAEK